MKNKVLMGITALLVGVIGFEIYYIFSYSENSEKEKSYINISGEQENNKEEDLPLEDNPDKVEDYVKLVNTKENGNQIIQEYEMVLNGEKKEFDITFEINEGVGYWDIESTLGDSYLFSVWYDTIPPNSYVDFIARYFNENNFIIFPGIDGINYLIVQDYSLPPAGGVGIKYNIFNQNWDYIGYLNVVYQGQSVVLENESVWYSNNFYIDTLDDDNKIRSEIEGNKIYNLYYTCDYMEERVYTINNNKLEYKVINQYEILETSGAAC